MDRLKRQKKTQTTILPFAHKKVEELTLELLIKEALISNVSFFDIYEHTFGELIEIVEAFREGQRRQNQKFSIIAMRQAELTAAYVAGKGKDLEIYDVFPFWNEEEKKEILVQKWKAKMLQIAAKGR